VCTLYGRMASSNELVACKSLGIHPLRLFWPALGVALVLSLLTVWLYDLAVTWCYRGVQHVVIDAVEDIAYGMLRSQRAFQYGPLSVTVKRVDARRLVQPTFTFQADDSSATVTITAQEAELRSPPGSGVLTVTCRHGTVDIGGTSFDFPD